MSQQPRADQVTFSSVVAALSAITNAKAAVEKAFLEGGAQRKLQEFGYVDGMSGDVLAILNLAAAACIDEGSDLVLPRGKDLRISGPWNIGTPVISDYLDMTTLQARTGDGYSGYTAAQSGKKPPRIIGNGCRFLADFAPGTLQPAVAYNLDVSDQLAIVGGMQDFVIVGRNSSGVIATSSGDTYAANNLLGVFAFRGARMLRNINANFCQVGVATRDWYWGLAEVLKMNKCGTARVSINDNASVQTQLEVSFSLNGLVNTGNGQVFLGIHTEQVDNDIFIKEGFCNLYQGAYLEDNRSGTVGAILRMGRRADQGVGGGYCVNNKFSGFFMPFVSATKLIEVHDGSDFNTHENCRGAGPTKGGFDFSNAIGKDIYINTDYDKAPSFTTANGIADGGPNYAGETVANLIVNTSPGLHISNPVELRAITRKKGDLVYSIAPVDSLQVVCYTTDGMTCFEKWAKNTAYSAAETQQPNFRDLIYNGGNVYRCDISGTSAATGTGPSGTGSTITDGTVVWSFQGVHAEYVPAAPSSSGGGGTYVPIPPVPDATLIDSSALPQGYLFQTASAALLPVRPINERTIFNSNLGEGAECSYKVPTGTGAMVVTLVADDGVLNKKALHIVGGNSQDTLAFSSTPKDATTNALTGFALIAMTVKATQTGSNAPGPVTMRVEILDSSSGSVTPSGPQFTPTTSWVTYWGMAAFSAPNGIATVNVQMKLAAAMPSGVTLDVAGIQGVLFHSKADLIEHVNARRFFMSASAPGVYQVQTEDRGLTRYKGDVAFTQTAAQGKNLIQYTTQGLTNFQKYAANTAYTADTVTPANSDRVYNVGNVYRCVGSGTSGASSPPTGTGSTITDNTVIWAYEGPHAEFVGQA